MDSKKNETVNVTSTTGTTTEPTPVKTGLVLDFSKNTLTANMPEAGSRRRVSPNSAFRLTRAPQGYGKNETIPPQVRVLAQVLEAIQVQNKDRKAPDGKPFALESEIVEAVQLAHAQGILVTDQKPEHIWAYYRPLMNVAHKSTRYRCIEAVRLVAAS